jgi:hypothetical protein
MYTYITCLEGVGGWATGGVGRQRQQGHGRNEAAWRGWVGIHAMTRSAIYKSMPNHHTYNTHYV